MKILLVGLLLTGFNANAEFKERTMQFYGRLYDKILCPDCDKVQSTCDLKSPAVARNIILVGENHKNEGSIKTKKELFDFARAKKIILATEVGTGDGALNWGSFVFSDFYGSFQNEDQIHGIESPVFFPLGVAYKLQKNNLYESSIQEISGQFIHYIRYLPLFRGAYEALRNQEQYKDVYQIMDSYLVNTEQALSHSTSGQMKVEISSQQEMHFRAFFTDLHKNIIDLAKVNFPKKLKGVKLPSILTRADSYRMDDYLFEFMGPELLFINERDIEFASRISDLLCEYAGNNQPFVVLVGDLHVPGVEKLLKNLSGGAIKFKYFKSFIPAQAQELIQEIN